MYIKTIQYGLNLNMVLDIKNYSKCDYGVLFLIAFFKML